MAPKCQSMDWDLLLEYVQIVKSPHSNQKKKKEILIGFNGAISIHF